MEFVSCELTGKLKEKGFPVKTKVEGKFGLTEFFERVLIKNNRYYYEKINKDSFNNITEN